MYYLRHELATFGKERGLFYFLPANRQRVQVPHLLSVLFVITVSESREVIFRRLIGDIDIITPLHKHKDCNLVVIVNVTGANFLSVGVYIQP
jgi:hypothetical protein